MKKVTLATIKSFMKGCNASLYVKPLSAFDGMVDCVMPCEEKNRWFNVSGRYNPDKSNTYGLGSGAWFVGGSRNWFSLYADDTYIGYEVSNCCGSFIVATLRKKAA
jgi:hypothetical protein